MIGVPGPGSRQASVLHIDGSLRVPVSRDLRRQVRALLRRGERSIVLDLTRIPSIDAAGVGELVRAYNMTSALNGRLRIVHTTAWVREILERVGLVGLLGAGREAA